MAYFTPRPVFGNKVSAAKMCQRPHYTVKVVSKASANVPANNVRIKKLLDTGEHVIAPGGIRPYSTVNIVEPGQVVALDGDTHKRLDLQKGEFIENAQVDIEVPVVDNGYIAFATYTEASTTLITYMTTTWTVPQAPTKNNNQTIFIFNGLEDNPVTHILQPVLQWGASADGGGGYWSIASWWADGQNSPSFKTPLIPVSPGEQLTGVMRLINKTGNTFSYSCSFVGYSKSMLTVHGANQLVSPYEALECYMISDCQDYPNALLTKMSGINVVTSNTNLPLSFGYVDRVTDCGQHCVIVNNNAGSGEVDLYYR